ncbi:MAG: hypothetical protein ACJAZ9_000798 [Neolewinella sp.]|jgi:hypothetical protein
MNKHRKTISLVILCLILGCTYVMIQDGISVGMVLTAISQCLLLVGMWWPAEKGDRLFE